jgi:hypothetical protein
MWFIHRTEPGLQAAWRLCFSRSRRKRAAAGQVAEWSKARAWKVRIRQKRIVGSNPTLSASDILLEMLDFQAFVYSTESRGLPRVCAPGQTRLRPSLAPDAPMHGGIVFGGDESHYAFVQNVAEIFRLAE